jgi:hypothetical protein
MGVGDICHSDYQACLSESHDRRAPDGHTYRLYEYFGDKSTGYAPKGFALYRTTCVKEILGGKDTTLITRNITRAFVPKRKPKTV